VYFRTVQEACIIFRSRYSLLVRVIFSALKLMSRGCVVRYSVWYYVLCIRKCLDKFITVFEQINDGRWSRSTLQYLYYKISAKSNKLLLTTTLNPIATRDFSFRYFMCYLLRFNSKQLYKCESLDNYLLQWYNSLISTFLVYCIH